MKDDFTAGHNRTLNDHKAWRVRDVQRAQAQSRADALAKSGIQFSTIVAVNRWGNVQLEQYIDQEGNGEWFDPSSDIFPVVGQQAMFLLNGAGRPVILGIAGNGYDSYRNPDPRYFCEQDHFLTGHGADTSGAIGQQNWFLTGAGSSAQKTTAESYGMGWHRLQVNGNNIALRSRYPLFLARRTRDIEVGFTHTHDVTQAIYIGLIDGVASISNGVYLRYDTSLSDGYWTLCVENGDVITAQPTDMPWVAGAYMVARLRNLLSKGWSLTLRNVDANTTSTVAITEKEPSSGLYLIPGSFYDRSSGTAKSLDIDYIRWTVFNVVQGAGDSWR